MWTQGNTTRRLRHISVAPTCAKNRPERLWLFPLRPLQIAHYDSHIVPSHWHGCKYVLLLSCRYFDLIWDGLELADLVRGEKLKNKPASELQLARKGLVLP